MPTPEQYERQIAKDAAAMRNLLAKAECAAAAGNHKAAALYRFSADSRRSVELHQHTLDRLRREQGGVVTDESGLVIGQAVPR